MADEDRSGGTSRSAVVAAIATIVVVATIAAVAASRRDRTGDEREPRDARDGTVETLPAVPGPPTATSVADQYEWSPLAIGGGGFVTGIVSAVRAEGTSAVYARTDVGGAYRWEPTTESWTQLLVADSLQGGRLIPPDYSVASIAVAPSDPDVVAVAVGDSFDPSKSAEGDLLGRVLWSTDGGATWLDSGQRWSAAVDQSYPTGREQLAIDPSDPRRALFGTQREGLWRTDDGGMSWQRVPDGQVPTGHRGDPVPDRPGVSSVSFVPADDGAPVAVVGVAGEGIYASDDLATWSRIVELDDDEVPAIATVAEDRVVLSIDTPGSDGARLIRLAGVASGPIDRITAEELATPGAASRWVVAVSPGPSGTMVLSDDAVRDGHFWTSVDDGRTWQTHDVRIDAAAVPWLGATDLVQYMTAGRLMFDPVDTDRLWFAEGMGVWTTDDPTAEVVTWTARSTGIEEFVVSDVVVPPGGAPIVTVADRQGFLVPDLARPPDRPLIDDGFASGAGVDFSGGRPERLAWIGAQSNLAPADMTPRGATSADGGETWQEMSGLEVTMFGGEVAVSATDPDRIVWLPAQRGGEPPDRLYSSGDGGRSWRQVRLDGGSDQYHQNFWWFSRRALAADRVDERIYLLSDTGRLEIIHDGGMTWTTAPHAPPCRVESDCHVFGQLRAAPDQPGQLWATTGSNGLFRSDDAGDSPWRQVGHFDDARAFGFGAPVGGSEHPAVYLYARMQGERYLQLWRSIDGGDEWQLVADQPGGIGAGVHVVSGDPNLPGRVYVGFTGAGVVHGDDRSGR